MPWLDEELQQQQEQQEQKLLQQDERLRERLNDIKARFVQLWLRFELKVLLC